MTFETFIHGDEETWPEQKKDNDKDKQKEKDNDKDKDKAPQLPAATPSMLRVQKQNKNINLHHVNTQKICLYTSLIIYTQIRFPDA